MTTIIIDFDSTFIQTEILEELAAIVLCNNNQRETILRKIIEMTKLAMAGQMSFSEALHKRLQLLTIHKSDLEQLIEQIKTKITPSFVQHKAYIKAHADNIYIISNGFSDVIVPVVADFGIAADHVLANKLMFAVDDVVTGVDETNVLAQDQGKLKLINAMDFPAKIYVIGDGFTDHEMQLSGKVAKFYLFVENVYREELTQYADKVIHSFAEFIQDVSS